MPDTRNILIPVDQSEHSVRALNWFVKYGSMPEDNITLFHSVETAGLFPAYSEESLGLSSIEAIVKEKEREVVDLKKKFESILEDFKIKGEFLSSVEFPHAGEAICHIANEKEIDYIVMGNRGIGTLRRTFLGSTSDYVLHHAHLPVTIIPPKREEKQSPENESEGAAN